MKKIILCIIVILFAILFISTGYRKRTDVVLTDYSVSEDGTKMTLKIATTSTIGYARELKVKQRGDNNYITFYSTFGFLNSKLGAKSEYEIELNPSCTEIYFYNGDGGYNLVLQKNDEEWEKARNNDNQSNMIGSRYDNPIVPNGFKKIETETASWELDEIGNPKGWNNGLVIEDEIGNQFVWVPVKDEDFGNFKREAETLIDEESEEEQNQMKRYGGFYVARYEAGVSENMQDVLENISEETNNVEGIPVSKSEIRVWNYISLNKAKKNATQMYHNDEIKSDLITTRQWLRTVNWIQESGYDFNDMRKLGNFADSFFNFIGLYSEDYGKTYKNGNPMGKVKNFILATGINESAKTNNIYDLFGNLMEFTDGYVEDRGYYSVGGYYSETASLKGAYLLGVEPLDKLGFRVVLYFK